MAGPISNIGGGIPQQVLGAQERGQKKLYYSRREQALLLDKTLRGGYGLLNAGTAMAINTDDNNKLVPFVQLDHDSLDVGRAYLVADGANGAAIVYMTLNDSYKFAVGDNLIAVRDNSGSPAYKDMGAIVTIDRTTYTHMAKITATTAFSDANFTVANKANVYVKTDSSTHYSKCSYILDKDVDTGEGAISAGAVAPVVVSNAVLYTNSLVGYDAAAATDMGSSSDGMFTILK